MQIVDKHGYLILWRLEFFHDNLCTVRCVQVYSVYTQLPELPGWHSAVLSVERTELSIFCLQVDMLTLPSPGLPHSDTLTNKHR